MPASPANGKTRPPTDQIILSDERKFYMLHGLEVLQLRRFGVRFLFDDDEGHEGFILWRALGKKDTSKDGDWSNLTSWFRNWSKAQRDAADQRVADFVRTLGNIAAVSRFTKADREKYAHEERIVGKKKKKPMQALLQLPLIDADIEDVRRDEGNTARRERWHKANAVATSKSDNPRWIAFIEAVAVIESTPGKRDLSVPNIIRKIEQGGHRGRFPHALASFRTIVYRLRHRLIELGILLPDNSLSGLETGTSLALAAASGTPILVTAAQKTPPAKSLKTLHFVVTPNRCKPKEIIAKGAEAGTGVGLGEEVTTQSATISNPQRSGTSAGPFHEELPDSLPFIEAALPAAPLPVVGKALLEPPAASLPVEGWHPSPSFVTKSFAAGEKLASRGELAARRHGIAGHLAGTDGAAVGLTPAFGGKARAGAAGSAHRRSAGLVDGSSSTGALGRKGHTGMITNVFRDNDVPSDAWLLAQIRILTIKLDELELRLRNEQGDAAFADYERTVARQIGDTGDADNVIGFRGRRSP